MNIRNRDSGITATDDLFTYELGMDTDNEFTVCRHGEQIWSETWDVLEAQCGEEGRDQEEIFIAGLLVFNEWLRQNQLQFR
jgi:hypothetical protein